MKKWFLTVLICLAGCQSNPTIPASTTIVEERHQTVKDAQSHLELGKFSQQKHPVVALVLGSGGARGYAHIGAIQALEQNGIHPDFIVGTSAGSVVGALYASGKTPNAIRQIALDMKVQDVRGFKLNKQGFLDGEKIEDFVNKQIHHTPLQNMKIPLYVVATELKTGKKTIFNYGNTGQAVRASVAIPSMFVPTLINQKEYVDGGLVSPVPADVAKSLGADIVIAVDILAQPQYTETTNMWGMFNQNINIMQHQMSQVELQQADVIIRPDIREKAHIFEVKERNITIMAGLLATQIQITKIKQLIESKQQQLNDRVKES